ncbi:hypothetical protein [Desulfovibrio sp.]|uniref:hypothetical protein n=1 Tax=Desulfovibrio sp. TaxID=885 RepID=UPI0025B9BBE3|nr:hypothetical protein [Desulfovibrio sp.]
MQPTKIKNSTRARKAEKALFEAQALYPLTIHTQASIPIHSSKNPINISGNENDWQLLLKHVIILKKYVTAPRG